MNVELPEIRYCPRCGGPVALKDTEGRDRPVCLSCGHIVYVNPVPAAALLVMEGGNILLILRAVEPKKGEWCLPGGFIEWGESALEGGRRELFEETGVRAGEMSLVGIYDSVTVARLHVLVAAFRVRSWTGQPTAGDDASDVRWFPVDSIPKLAFDMHERAIGDLREMMNREDTGC